MHARGPLIRRSQTTGSMVVCLEPENRFRIFITGSSAPCLSTFKPCLPSSMPADLAKGGASFSNDSYWWRHEVFHINVLMRYARVSGAIAVEISDLEQRFSIPVPGYRWERVEPVVQELSEGIFRETEQMEKSWLAQMLGIKEQGSPLVRSFWKRIARRNGISLIQNH